MAAELARNNRRMDNVLLENARIMFRNFSGKEGKYNKEGDRNFVIFLDDDIANQMARDGWNIKQLKAREDDEGEPQSYIQIAVGFKGRPPTIFMVTSRGKTPLGEEEVSILDWVQIATTDVIIRPYNWSVNGNTGVKAYLKSIFVTIEEDALDLKYAGVMDSAQSLSPQLELEESFIYGEVVED